MAKRQKVMYEEMVFDNYQDAVNVKTKAEETLARIDRVKLLAILGTVAGIGWIFLKFDLLFFASFILSCICYAIVKCFGGAIKWAVNFSKFGWYICPFFPMDLIILLVFFFVGFFAFFFLPFFVVNGVKKQNTKDLECANEYLGNYQSQTQEN